MNYRLNQITKPVSEPVVLSDVEGHCRINDLSDESATIDIFIEAMRQQCESVTRRALITQKWELLLDEFPLDRNPVEIPLPPLQSIEEIKYLDLTGVEQVLDPLTYRVIKSANEKCQPGFVIPIYGSVWPVALNDYNSVTISFTCGYGPIGEDTSSNVPKAIKQWMLLNIANLYENRETIQLGNRLTAIELTTVADGLINDFRITRL